MPHMLPSLFATLLISVYSHPAGLECGTDASTRLRVGQTIMKSTVATAPTDSPVKVDVQGSTVTVSSKAGIFFAAKAFGEGASLSLSAGDASLNLTKTCTNQVYTVDGKSASYTFTHDKAESIVVGYSSKPSVVSLITVKVSAVAEAMDMKCPSGPLVHASAQITTTAAASCGKVKEEILARIAGQATGAWHDPHNNGTYHIDDSSTDSLKIHRVTGNHKPGPYTDDIILTLSSAGSAGTCKIEGCSASQTFSVADFGTNYCNIRMLYCGSADGCKPVAEDFSSPEGTVQTSPGASKGIQNCLKVRNVIV